MLDRIKKKIRIVLFVLALMICGFTLHSQTPPPPINHGNEGGPVGGSAPIGDGLWVLIIMGSAYALYKLYPLKQKISKQD